MKVASFYRFLDIDDPASFRTALQILCNERALLGTVLVASLGAAPRSSLWLGVTAILIAVGQLDGFVREIPVSTQTWQVANVIAYLAGIACFVVSVHRMVDYHAPRFEFGLGALAVSLAVWCAASGPYAFITVATGILSSTAVLLAYALWRAYSAGSGSTRVGSAASRPATTVYPPSTARDARSNRMRPRSCAAVARTGSRRPFWFPCDRYATRP